MNARSLWCCAGLFALTSGCATILGFEDPEEAQGQTNGVAAPGPEASTDASAMADGVANVGVADVGVADGATTTTWGFKDDFASTVRSPRWEIDSNCAATFEQRNGELSVLVPGGRELWGTYVTRSLWPLVGAHASVKVPEVIDREGEVGLAVRTYAGDQYAFYIVYGTLYARPRLDGTYLAEIRSAPYVPTRHAWLRIRYDAPADVVFETSEDGSAWLLFTRETWRLKSTDVQVALFAYRAAPPTGVLLPAVFDDFELAKNP